MKKPCALALTLSLKCCRKSKAAASTGKAPAPVEDTGRQLPAERQPAGVLEGSGAGTGFPYWKGQGTAAEGMGLKGNRRDF